MTVQELTEALEARLGSAWANKRCFEGRAALARTVTAKHRENLQVCYHNGEIETLDSVISLLGKLDS
jgi:hypothetical protein